ncbi:hypothetical protein [Morganella morganii]|uniref:hypothetical protein n=1 Tax=Morganella morganii TaxID=582 RepID=UPI000BFC533D|nr:hypothetical protein [Morganella morganii]PHH11190.1 hypothetical protein CRX48_00860 [Morganella morganii]
MKSQTTANHDKDSTLFPVAVIRKIISHTEHSQTGAPGTANRTHQRRHMSAVNTAPAATGTGKSSPGR